MIKRRGITLDNFCDFHQVERRQVMSFADFGLVKMEKKENHFVIPEDQIEHLERFLRLSNELGVNLEGLEIIHRMRKRLIMLQRELEMHRRMTGREGRISGEDDDIEYLIIEN